VQVKLNLFKAYDVALWLNFHSYIISAAFHAVNHDILCLEIDFGIFGTASR